MTDFLDKVKFNFQKKTKKIKIEVLRILQIILLIIIFIISFRNSSIYSNIIYMSNSLASIDIFPNELKLIQTIYPIFDAENYIMNVEYTVAENVEKEEEKLPIIIDNVNYGSIDDIDVSLARNYFNSISDVNVYITDGPGYEAVYINDNVLIKDFSDLPNINYKEIVNRNINITKSNDKVFIYSTHASETYTTSEEFNFSYSSTFRTLDENYNMISVAKKISNFLESKNISVIHDGLGHDYGSYTNSYGSSGASVLRNIEMYGNFGLSLDIHRDAIEDLSYAPKVSIGNVDVAQCMIVIGVGYDGMRNDYYDENLGLAIKMMLLAEEIYPGLFRPMIIRNSTYNQHLNNMSLLIEVGCTGNTLEEAYRSAKCIANLIDIIYKE